ncbi:MAG: hypothetical protein K8T89_27160, partial [Planctomycetes bacterium]|nr:hypothetical protein [Planctomycetota bacterium]
MPRNLFLAFASLILLTVKSTPVKAEDKPVLDKAGFEKVVVPFLQKHCVACHGAIKPKSDLSLHDVKIEDLAKGTTAVLWSGILERLATGNMPPEDQPRPDCIQTGKVAGWIRTELIRTGHGSDLAFPDKGNHLSHDLFFNQPSDAHPSTPARIWRISPHHYEARACTVMGRAPRPPQGFQGKVFMPRPFGLRGGPGIQDYSFLYRIDEAQTEQLLLNAREIARRMMGGPGGYEEKPTVHRALQTYMKVTTPYTPEQINSIVESMSQLILRRKATEEEAKRYTSYLAQQVEKHGNLKGLESIIAAILLNPEILFRFELGDGKPD